MARIRTIKPEFCTSTQVVECSRNARLLFVLMWMFCDDNGIHPANAKQLRMECFPGDDDMTSDVVQGLVDELKQQQLLTEFENDGARYLSVTGWKHQRIDKPQPGKYPTLGDKNSRLESGAIQDHSVNDSENAPRTLPPDRKGKEGKGEEGIGGGDPGTGSQAKRKHQLPQDFVLTAERSFALKAEAPQANPQAEFAQFCDHHRSRGNTMLDWDAAWRTWCRNAAKFGAKQRSSSGSTVLEHNVVAMQEFIANGTD